MTLTKEKISVLRTQAKYWPELTFIEEDVVTASLERAKFLFITTLVRIKRDGKWYKVHVIEFCFVTLSMLNPERVVQTCINRTLHTVNIVQLFWKLNGLEELDIDISEEERLNPIQHV